MNFKVSYLIRLHTDEQLGSILTLIKRKKINKCFYRDQQKLAIGQFRIDLIWGLKMFK